MSPLGAKRAKIALIVVLFGAAGYFAYAYFLRPGPLANSLQFVCAASGERFWFSREQAFEIPMLNPRTKEPTLVPVLVDESGALYVPERYRGVLEELGEKNKFVDMESLRLKTH